MGQELKESDDTDSSQSEFLPTVGSVALICESDSDEASEEALSTSAASAATTGLPLPPSSASFSASASSASSASSRSSALATTPRTPIPRGVPGTRGILRDALGRRDVEAVRSIVAEAAGEAGEAGMLVAPLLRAAAEHGGTELGAVAAELVDALEADLLRSLSTAVCWKSQTFSGRGTEEDTAQQVVELPFFLPRNDDDIDQVARGTRSDEEAPPAADPLFVVQMTKVPPTNEIGVLATIPEALWPGSVVMSSFLCSKRGRRKLLGERCLEIGCGQGLVGLCAAYCGASSVTLTDTDRRALSIARKNVHLNSRALADRCKRINVDRLCWSDYQLSSDGKFASFDDQLRANACTQPREDAWMKHAPFDVILGSDLVYSDEPANAVELHACLVYLLEHWGTNECKAFILLPPADIRYGVQYFECLVLEDPQLSTSLEYMWDDKHDVRYTLLRIRLRDESERA